MTRAEGRGFNPLSHPGTPYSKFKGEPFVLETMVFGGDFPSDPTTGACEKFGWMTTLSPPFTVP